MQEQINKQNEKIEKQNEILAKLQDHVAQVFGEVDSINNAEEDIEKDVAEDAEEDVEEDADAGADRDDISAMLSEDSDPNEPYEEELEEVLCPENTDFTRCEGTEQNGEKCIRIRRNGNYCWYHDPDNPQVCHKCGKRLRVKSGVEVNGKIKDPTGLFEKCDCHKTASLHSHSAPVSPIPSSILTPFSI